MALSADCRKLIAELGNKVRFKGWSEEDGQMLALMSVSIDMREATGGDCEAVRKVTEFVNESKDSSECFYKVLEYLGADMSHWDDEPDDEPDDDSDDDQ